jgi:hypothetical protein
VAVWLLYFSGSWMANSYSSYYCRYPYYYLVAEKSIQAFLNQPGFGESVGKNGNKS